MALLGIGFNPLEPGNEDLVSEGPFSLRDLKLRIKQFFQESFDLDSGEMKPGLLNNQVTKPFGPKGSVYVSNGPSSEPSWGTDRIVSNAPVGLITMFGGIVPPDGFLECNGSTIYYEDYPDLVMYFNSYYPEPNEEVPDYAKQPVVLPKFDGRTPWGDYRSDAFKRSDGVGGEESHVLGFDELNSHVHPALYVAPTGVASGTDLDAIKLGSALRMDTAGGGGAHNNLQPSIGIMFIIKT